MPAPRTPPVGESADSVRIAAVPQRFAMARLIVAGARVATIGVLHLSCLAASPLHGQVQRRLALDLSLGQAVGLGDGDRYRPGRMLSAEATLSVRLRNAPGHSLAAAVGTGMAGRRGDDVAISAMSVRDFRSPFPRSRIRFAMVGWEWLAHNGAALRLLTGPGWDVTAHAEPDERVGWQVLGDFGVAIKGPFGAVASVRWGQSTHGPRGLHLFGAGLGLRIR